MVAEIYLVRQYLHVEAVKYGLDPMHPSGNECSSVQDDDNSDDDKIEELYSDPAAPARGRVWGVERVEIVIDPTPSATAHVQDNRCADDNLCGTKTVPLTIGDHVCLTAFKLISRSVYGTHFCVAQWQVSQTQPLGAGVQAP